MPDDAGHPPPEEIILYEQDPETRNATITLNRSGFPDTTAIGAPLPPGRRRSGKARAAGA